MLSTTMKSYDFGPFNKYESLIDEILNSGENSTVFESDNFPKNAILFLILINNKRNNKAKKLFENHILDNLEQIVDDEELCFIVKSLCTIITIKQERIHFLKKIDNKKF